jgi:type I restriction-modification system DNA methylase subunit
MGAVYSSIDVNMKKELDNLRKKASERSEDTLWALEFDIDNKTADLIGSNPPDVKQAIINQIRALIDEWKLHLA